MSHKDTLTAMVRSAVVKSGMSQYEFAAQCGFSHRVIGRLLRGTDIRLGTADKLLKAMKIKVIFVQE